MEKTVADPEGHLAVFRQQGRVKDKAAQELLQHGGPEVSANEARCRVKSKDTFNRNIGFTGGKQGPDL